MKIHNPRKVSQWKMFTLSGKPVYNYGYTKHTLLKEGHRLECICLEKISKHQQDRLERAAKDVGEPCEWVKVKDSEIMDVSF